MASEVISLLHGLLSSAASDTAKIWATAVREVLCEALECVPNLIDALSDDVEFAVQAGSSSDTEHPEEGPVAENDEWSFKARHVVAALCALGGFKQSVRTGCVIKVCACWCVRCSVKPTVRLRLSLRLRQR